MISVNDLNRMKTWCPSLPGSGNDVAMQLILEIERLRDGLTIISQQEEEEDNHSQLAKELLGDA